MCHEVRHGRGALLALGTLKAPLGWRSRASPPARGALSGLPPNGQARLLQKVVPLDELSDLNLEAVHLGLQRDAVIHRRLRLLPEGGLSRFHLAILGHQLVPHLFERGDLRLEVRQRGGQVVDLLPRHARGDRVLLLSSQVLVLFDQVLPALQQGAHIFDVRQGLDLEDLCELLVGRVPLVKQVLDLVRQDLLVVLLALVL
mmetsp:Transcript_50756/g.149650  ORF Transcript_50756/g.149650 Transcript_50756/m.149650 type:complete len:201 (+) Transcript_50756:163-765(+)